MNDLISTFTAFWASWGPFISIMLIPTLITGLSLSPRTEKASGLLEKAWVGFMRLLEILSIATYKDDPGTFKFPLQKSSSKKDVVQDKVDEKVEAAEAKEAEKDKTDGPGPGPGAGAGACAALFILGTSFGHGGCSWFRGETAGQIKDGAIACTIQAVQSNARSLLPTILAIITGKGDWKRQTEALFKEFGRDVVGCALVIASQELMLKVPAAGTAEHDQAIKDAQTGVLRASEFINEKNWTFAEGQ